MLIANLLLRLDFNYQHGCLVAQVVWVLELVRFIVLFYRVITSY